MVSIYGPRDSKFDPIVREKEARIAALGAERDALLADNAKLRAAASNLIADVQRRYPGEELRCPYMIALDKALRGGEVENEI